MPVISGRIQTMRSWGYRSVPLLLVSVSFKCYHRDVYLEGLLGSLDNIGSVPGSLRMLSK